MNVLHPQKPTPLLRQRRSIRQHSRLVRKRLLVGKRERHFLFNDAARLGEPIALNRLGGGFAVNGDDIFDFGLDGALLGL